MRTVTAMAARVWIAGVLAMVGCGGGPEPASPLSRSARPAARPPATEPAASGTVARHDPPPFDAAPWIDDFRQLLDEMSSHYANLESARDDRHTDLPRLARDTERDLRAARDADGAKRALQSFVRAFGDGHLSIDTEGEGAGANASSRASSLCARLGYGARRVNDGVDFTLVPGFERSDDADAADMPGGVLRLRSKAKVGIVRIGIFMADAHPALCEKARAALALGDDAPCEDTCNQHLEEAVSNLLLAALERRLVALQKAGAQSIVVDLMDNGGGSDWVDPAARAIAPIALQAPRMAFVRHPHWVKHLREHLHDLEIDLAKPPDARRAQLVSAGAALHAALDEAERPCDLRPLWQAGAPAPVCSMLVRAPFHSSGLLAYAKPSAFDGLESAGTLFGPGQYFHYREQVNRLPVLVLVNDRTASAAELFTAMMRDNGAATVVGQTTTGSGCGYTNGGIATALPRSGLHARMPDCVRLRADGSNEVIGIVPDVLVPFARRDSPYQRAVKAIAGLEIALSRRATPRRP